MRRFLALSALMAGALLCSCRPASRAYLVADGTILAVMGGDKAATSMVASAAARRGLELRVLPVTKEDSADQLVDKALGDTGCRLVLVLTSVPVDLRERATEHAGVLFAGYGERASAKAANLLLLTAGREGAFEEAGRRAGLAARGSEGAKVGILAVSPTATAKGEIGAFRKGLSEQVPEAEPLYREVRSISDKASAVRMLREMREAGAGFFLLKAYGLTGPCLEDLARDGGKAVVEDCGGSEACGGEVMLSVETDWPGTLALVFDAMAPAMDGWRSQEIGEAWRLDEGGRDGGRS